MMTKSERNEYMRVRYAARPDARDKAIACATRYYRNGGNVVVREKNLELKLEVLTHYGDSGLLLCCWSGCEVQDLDMLTIDHVNEDGAQHRRELGCEKIYRWLKKNKFPEGFQTLCMNHQWKKHLQFLRNCR
jgi:hypothetical protein